MLYDRWRNTWMMAWDRQRRLQEKLAYQQELEKVKNFSWDDWRRRVRIRLGNIFKGLHKLIFLLPLLVHEVHEPPEVPRDGSVP